MPSFDTVLEANLVEVKNAVEQTSREVGTRFDFKGTSAKLELKDKTVTLFGDSDFQITQVDEILRNKLAKAGGQHHGVGGTEGGRAHASGAPCGKAGIRPAQPV
jgi:uncharacterized protein YajQ (UPF0234 family)